MTAVKLMVMFLSKNSFHVVIKSSRSNSFLLIQSGEKPSVKRKKLRSVRSRTKPPGRHPRQGRAGLPPALQPSFLNSSAASLSSQAAASFFRESSSFQPPQKSQLQGFQFSVAVHTTSGGCPIKYHFRLSHHRLRTLGQHTFY